MTHICVSKLAIIGSGNGLSPGRRQAIIWTNAGLLLVGHLGTNFSEMLIDILTFSFKKMRLKVSSAKRRPFCLGLNVLKQFYSPAQLCNSKSNLVRVPQITPGWLEFELRQTQSNQISLFRRPVCWRQYRRCLCTKCTKHMVIRVVHAAVNPLRPSEAFMRQYDNPSLVLIKACRQAVIRTNARILLIGPKETNFSQILIEIHTFQIKCIWKGRLHNSDHFVLASMR